jgi:hypothetical protein
MSFREKSSQESHPPTTFSSLYHASVNHTLLEDKGDANNSTSILKNDNCDTEGDKVGVEVG